MLWGCYLMIKPFFIHKTIFTPPLGEVKRGLTSPLYWFNAVLFKILVGEAEVMIAEEATVS